MGRTAAVTAVPVSLLLQGLGEGRSTGFAVLCTRAPAAMCGILLAHIDAVPPHARAHRSTFLGSRALAGSLIRHGQLASRGADGLSFEDVLRASGVAEPAEAVAGLALDAKRLRHYVEVHIEQGPQLEAAGKALGVVSGIAGQTWLAVAVEGVQNHGGGHTAAGWGWHAMFAVPCAVLCHVLCCSVLCHAPPGCVLVVVPYDSPPVPPPHDSRRDCANGAAARPNGGGCRGCECCGGDLPGGH